MFRTQMKALSAKSSRRDAGWNAMFWATFELVDPSTQMSFYSTADAKVTIIHTYIYENCFLLLTEIDSNHPLITT